MRKIEHVNEDTHTRTPVTIEAIKVPRIANVTMAPKFEKNGFCKLEEGSRLLSIVFE